MDYIHRELKVSTTYKESLLFWFFWSRETKSTLVIVGLFPVHVSVPGSLTQCFGFYVFWSLVLRPLYPIFASLVCLYSWAYSVFMVLVVWVSNWACSYFGLVLSLLCFLAPSLLWPSSTPLSGSCQSTSHGFLFYCDSLPFYVQCE